MYSYKRINLFILFFGGYIMNISYNEFLRIMTSILIVILVAQGLDYVFGFGVNYFFFIIFCITFAFMMGTIYYNIIEERRKQSKSVFESEIKNLLDGIQEEINDEYEVNGLTDEILERQVRLNVMRSQLDMKDGDDGFVQ